MTTRAAAPVLLMVFAGWFVFASAPAAPPAPSGVELKAVKYRELTRAIRAQRGKVVVVDIWGVF
jgi:hypothetical protein